MTSTKKVLIGLVSFLAILVAVAVVPYGTQSSTPTASGGSTRTFVVTSTTAPGASSVLQVCFPREKQACDQVLVNWISKANHTVNVMIYSFTLSNVAQALVAAQKRGVIVHVVQDKSESGVQGSQLSALQSAGIDDRIAQQSGLMHSKVTIIDDFIVITGSYNYSNAAQDTSSENLVVIQGKDFNAAYQVEFARVEAISK